MKPTPIDACPPKFFVVIGASVIGLNALIETVASLEKGIDTAYCIVLHLSKKAFGDFVKRRLALVASMPCNLISNKKIIEKDNIYIAAPNHDMLIAEGSFVSSSGLKMRDFRPSIDMLFSSVALAYGKNAIGIVLSGSEVDGVEGMRVIKNAKGTCIVQDPKHAEYPEMPMSVVNRLVVDYIVPINEIGAAVIDSIQRRKKEIVV